jgi:hypothetical protein
MSNENKALTDLEKKTFTTQEGPNRGKDKPGPHNEVPSDKKPKTDGKDKK